VEEIIEPEEVLHAAAADWRVTGAEVTERLYIDGRLSKNNRKAFRRALKTIWEKQGHQRFRMIQASPHQVVHQTKR